MKFNIHPIVVHFPISLLVVYSFLKLIPCRKIFPKLDFKTTEKVLLFLGFLTILLASSTGEEAAEMTNPDLNLVDKHNLFANITTFFYGFLFGIEFLPWVNNFLKPQKWFPIKVKEFLQWVEKVVENKFLIILLVILGIVSLTITGVLGGVMVYGTSADPIAPFVLSILGL